VAESGEHFPGMLFRLVNGLSVVLGTVPGLGGRGVALAAGLAAAGLWRSERRFVQATIERVFHRLGRPLPRPIGSLLDRLFVHFALNLYEVLTLPHLPPAQLQQRVRFSGLQHLDAALAAGRGVILISPHLGNWEYLGSALARAGYPMNSFYLSQKENDLGAAIDHLRRFSGMALHDRDRGGVAARKALRRGEILGMVADQDGGNTGVYMDFLGHWVSMPAGPANWSLKTGARVLPVVALRDGLGSTFQARLYPALADETAPTLTDRVIARTQRLADWMESLILRFPEQYLWFYDRFKPRHIPHAARLRHRGCEMVHGSAVLGLIPGDDKGILVRGDE
jgi:Kdo2-lipid IVA lauroyltransferase/acyltransferase